MLGFNLRAFHCSLNFSWRDSPDPSSISMHATYPDCASHNNAQSLATQKDLNLTICSRYFNIKFTLVAQKVLHLNTASYRSWPPILEIFLLQCFTAYKLYNDSDTYFQ